MVELAATNGDKGNTGLKAKEKVLLQLGEHRTEPDDAPLPFEITQKGLADYLGLRRSHVASALQNLVREGRVTVHKGHIEGEDRRQNAYFLTEEGARKADEIRVGFVGRSVMYEGEDGAENRKIADIVASRGVPLSSVILQLDKGGVVRDEINILSESTSRLIPVFCPTCQKRMEVENTYRDDQVAFDCPGCGRPYKISPVLENRASARRRYPGWVYAFAVVITIAGIYFAIHLNSLCFIIIALVIVAIAGVVFLLTDSPDSLRRKEKPDRRPTPAGTLLFSLLFGFLLIASWHLFVIDIDLWDEALVVLPLFAGVVFGFYGIALSASQLRGEFLFTVGLFLVLIGVTIMFTEEFGELKVSTVPFLGMLGGALLGLTRFEDIEGNEAKLGTATAFGSYLLFLTPVVLLPECASTGDFAAAGVIVSVGIFLVSLRIAQTIVAGCELGEMLGAAVPLVAAFGLVLMAATLIAGGALVAGAFELVVMLPFGYLGARMVFDEMWMYKLPIVVFLSGAVLLVTVLALNT
ncbi:MAG: winged helix-turn-helix transcriptional regulator [Methanobacteriota archaeon]|nr:MAG: winged helix-turn-helix transcriptional regulator [Euryarchaeota archaeon]